MQTRLSTKGQVVIPSEVRRKLDIRPGDPLEAALEGQRIVLIPRRARPRALQVIRDPVTGLPALTAGRNAPKLTSALVRGILAEFP